MAHLSRARERTRAAYQAVVAALESKRRLTGPERAILANAKAHLDQG